MVEFYNFKKGISPVVATALLLVVAVISVVGFQGWFTQFSSSTFVDVESQTSSSNSVVVEDLIGNNLYLNSNDNTTINSVKINNVDCNINTQISGLDSINVSSCIENLSGSVNIVVTTNNKIIESFTYVSNNNVNLNTITPPSSITCSNNTPENFYNGSGTLIDPWEICDCNQLQNMNNYLRGNFTLASNIDCSQTSTWNSGLGFIPIGNTSNYYEGNFDGLNYEISDLTINNPGVSGLGLFGTVKAPTNFSNFKLTNIYIKGSSNLGSVVGIKYNFIDLIIFDNVKVIGIIEGTGNNIGGFISDSGRNTIIKNSYFVGKLNGSNNIGGFIGSNNRGSVFNSFTNVNITGWLSLGGIMGADSGTPNISNSYSTGEISGNREIGGIVGYGYNLGTVENSYSTVKISGSTLVGGLVGDDTGSATPRPSVYWDTITSNQSTSGYGVGYTTSQLQNPTSNVGIYLNWSTAVWNFGTNSQYPKLIWE